MKNIGVLVLAAGQAARMGHPKQIIPWEGKPLIRHIVNIASSLPLEQLVVVTGAYSEVVTNALTGSSARCLFCPQWQEGMAASLRTGLEHLMSHSPELSGLLLLLGDQPLVTASYLQTLLSVFQTRDTLFVASAYAGTTGPPAVFSSALFPELLEIRGDQGAKRILEIHRGRGIVLPFEQGAIDLDTPEDVLYSNG